MNMWNRTRTRLLNSGFKLYITVYNCFFLLFDSIKDVIRYSVNKVVKLLCLT